MPARNKGADQTLQTNCESVRKAAVPQLERQVKRRKNFLSGAFWMICNMAAFPT